MSQRSVTYDGHTVQLIEFSDTDQTLFRDIESDSDTSRRSKRTRGSKVRDTEGEKVKKRRKKPEMNGTQSNLIVRLNMTKREDGIRYAFNSVVNPTKPAGKKRGRKPKVIMDDDEMPVKQVRGPRKIRKNHYEVYFDLTSEINKVNYESMLQQFSSRKPEEWYCCVCFGDTATRENPYVCCAQCGCVVHKYCYGVENVPENPATWLCDYCQYVQDNSLPWKGNELVCQVIRLSLIDMSFVLLYRRCL